MTLGFAFAPTAHAYPSYGANIPNGRINSALPAGESNTRCWNCHNSAWGGYGTDCSGSFCLNSFGLDFRSTVAGQHAAYGWDRWLAAVDSDNDGWSNGQELRSFWGGTSVNSTRYTLPGNPSSLSCSQIPSTPASRLALRNACFSELSSATYSTYATSSRFEPRETALNVCSSTYTSDCATTADCTRNSGNGRGDWSCSCDTGYSGTGHRRTTNHDFSTPNNTGLGDDRLYSIRSTLVSGCVNINECIGNPCGGNGSCSENLPGQGYDCNCNAGYRFSGGTCIVDNECSTNPTRCGFGTCVEQSPPQTFSCNCNAGYTFLGGTCVANNACVANIDDCDDDHGLCASSSGTNWNCTCESGWAATGTIFRGRGDVCTDVNECSRVNPCGLGTCQNLPGSYTCRCPSGYRDNGTTCVDIDECRTGDPCGIGGTRCTNTPGSYTCSCSPGYEFGSGTCQDIDECLPMPCGPGTCSQIEPPRYTCECDIGYFFDGRECLDIDECDDPAVALCSLEATCANIPGSHTCTCNDGYEGDGNVCTDVDECANATTNECAVNARCENTAGAYDCECNEGFTGSGLVCNDIDECATPNVCGLNETCIDNAAGLPPECACSEGFARDEESGDCIPACGDGARTVTESCDDGNTADGDGCSAECDTEDGFVCWESAAGLSECANTCGNGLIDRGETCDDGDDNSDTMPAACRTTCQTPACGDGILDEGEVCDEGEANTNDDPAGCRTTCLNAFCGDEIVDEGETCDPGGGEALPEESCMCGDAGARDAGVDAGESGPSGGSGCAVGSDSSPLGFGILFGLALLWRRRRR